MPIAKRNGRRWYVNETLSLHREYELLKWSIDKIAAKHQRTVNAIMFKLNSEGIADYNFLYGKYYNAYPVIELEPSLSENEFYYGGDESDNSERDYWEEEEEDEEDEEDDEEEEDDHSYDPIEDLAERIWNLEINIKNISNMLGEMFH
jgi:hypothetical protein